MLILPFAEKFDFDPAPLARSFMMNLPLVEKFDVDPVPS